MNNKKEIKIYEYMSNRELEELIKKEEDRTKVFIEYLKQIINERRKEWNKTS